MAVKNHSLPVSTSSPAEPLSPPPPHHNGELPAETSCFRCHWPLHCWNVLCSCQSGSAQTSSGEALSHLPTAAARPLQARGGVTGRGEGRGADQGGACRAPSREGGQRAASSSPTPLTSLPVTQPPSLLVWGPGGVSLLLFWDQGRRRQWSGSRRLPPCTWHRAAGQGGETELL